MASIAVVGGNLLGCATALQLARVAAAERDAPRDAAAAAAPAAVTLYEAAPALGGRGLAHVDAGDGVTVEVGSTRLLRPAPGSFVADLVDSASGDAGAAGPLRRLAAWRGTPPALRLRRVGAKAARGGIPDFAVWAWADGVPGDYVLRHGGFRLLAVAEAAARFPGLRAAALAAAAYYGRDAFAFAARVANPAARARAALRPVVLLAAAALGPASLMRRFATAAAFWATTALLIARFGLVVAVARGADLGFAAQMADVRTRGTARLCVTVGRLLERTALELYCRSTAADAWERFRYHKGYAATFLAPVVRHAYPTRAVEEVNAVAASLALVCADFANVEIAEEYVVVEGGNRGLCGALLDAARKEISVEARLARRVTSIAFDTETRKYTVGSVAVGEGGDGAVEERVYDGVVMCANIDPDAEDAIDFRLAPGVELRELLGETEAEAAAEAVEEASAEGEAAEEAAGEASAEGEAAEEVAGEASAERETAEKAEAAETELEQEREEPSVGSHTAVVRGALRPAFFGFAREIDVPERVQVNGSDVLSFFERAAAPDESSRGVYLVDCGEDFCAAEGPLSRMFASGADVLYFEERAPARGVGPFALEGSVDDSAAYFVLGERLVYAAASDRLARHPEMDGMSAMNAASLFSAAVDWAGDRAPEAAEGDPDDTDFPEDGEAEPEA